MATFKIKEEAYVKYQMTTWQGEIEYNGKTITYRYSEDDNGTEVLILDNESHSWTNDHECASLIGASLHDCGNPEELGGSGEEVEVDDELLEDY